MSGDVVERKPEGWLLIKRGLYWRPDSQDYTGVKEDAGRYPLILAEERCFNNGDVSMVHEDDAPDFSSACFTDIKQMHPLRKTITSQAAEIEALTKDLAHANANHSEMVARNRVLRDRPDLPVDRLPALDHFTTRAETAERLLAEARAALVPSAETKADYIGEFQFTVTMMELDESDEPYECQRMVTVPWTTIKEIMAAISARTLTNGGENGR